MMVEVTNTGRATVIKPEWPTRLVSHQTRARAYGRDGRRLRPDWNMSQLHWVELGQGSSYATDWLPMPWSGAESFKLDVVHGRWGNDYRRSVAMCSAPTPVPALPWPASAILAGLLWLIRQLAR